MPQVSDGGGQYCPPSNMDLQGQIDNIIDRIKKLETTVAQLSSQDVNAQQLSDISPATGWITNVTYLGTAGWTQTQAGTLIPPPGVSLSSLGLFPSGAQLNASTGTTSGGGFSGGGGGGSSKFSQALYCDATVATSGVFQQLPFSSPAKTHDTIGITYGSDYFTVPRTGYYFVSVNVHLQESFNPTSVYYIVEVYCEADDIAEDLLTLGSFVNDGSGNYSQIQQVQLSGIVHLTAGSNCVVGTTVTLSGGSSYNTRINDFAIMELESGGGGGGITEYIRCKANTTALTGGSNPSLAVDFSSGSIWDTSDLVDGLIGINSAGVFLINAFMPAVTPGASDANMFLNVYDDGGGVDDGDSMYDYFGPIAPTDYTFKISTIIKLDGTSGNQVYLSFSGVTSLESLSGKPAIFEVIKLA